MTAFGHWLPAIARNSVVRKSALGLAGLACVGGAVAGPAGIAQAAPTAKPVAAQPVSKDKSDDSKKSDKSGDKQAPSAKDQDVQYEAQPNFFYCGPAATRIALTALGQTPSQDDVAKQLGTTTAGTNSAEDTTRVLNAMAKTDFYKTKSIPGPAAKPEEMDRLQADVVRAIDSGHPVVANIAGTATDVAGNVHSFEGGHYLTIVGYEDDGRIVKIADPANVNGQNHYSMTTIDMANWIATRGYSA